MKYFGTDGIRGKAEIFDDALLARIAKTTARHAGIKRVLIARDTRTSGEDIALRLAHFLQEEGLDVFDFGKNPTPVAAFLTRTFYCGFGIVISASHNPPEYNGIKFFGEDGGKLSERMECLLESGMDDTNPSETKPKRGKRLVLDGEALYIAYLKTRFPVSLKGLRVLLDTANGAAAHIAPNVFRAFLADVTVIHQETDGVRINQNCGATCIGTLKAAMQEGNYDIGFSYDGDADRLMMVKDDVVYDGDRMLYLAARYFMQKDELRNLVAVGTIMTNLGAERAFQKRGIALTRTSVGDKYVLDEMRKSGVQVGGESSGHLIFSDYQTTGDGVLSSLLMATIEKEVGVCSLNDYENYPQISKDIITTAQNIAIFKQKVQVDALVQTAKARYDARLVVRASGTEPRIRVMAEAETEAKALGAATWANAQILEVLNDKL